MQHFRKLLHQMLREMLREMLRSFDQRFSYIIIVYHCIQRNILSF